MLEGRKLQLSGGSTFLVSLPRGWVIDRGLKAGDTLCVETDGSGSIVIRPNWGERRPVRRKLFDERSAGAPGHLLRKLIGAYIAGFGLIEVRFPPDRATATRRIVREFCQLVVGPEVIEENRTSLLIQDLSDASELSTTKCLRRMHLVVRTMVEEAVRGLRDPDPAVARDVDLRGHDIDRLYWMVAKHLHTPGRSPGEPGSPEAASTEQGHLLVAKLLERTADHARRIARACPELAREKGIDPRTLEELKRVSESALALLDKAFYALVSGDLELANAAIDGREAHRTLVAGAVAHLAGRRVPAGRALGPVLESLDRMVVYTTDIAEQAVNLAVLDPVASPA